MSDKKQNWFKKHKILTVVLGVVGLFISIGMIADIVDFATGNMQSSTASSSTSQKTATPPADTTPKLNQPARDGKFEFTVTGIQCGQSQLENDNEFETATAQGQFCVMKLSIRNIGTEAQSFDDSSQYLYDSSNKQYTADESGSTAANPSDSQCNGFPTINPGVSMSCAVAFDIPKAVTPVYAILHDSGASGGVRVALR